jgi:transcriptional regulator NrdR family protein
VRCPECGEAMRTKDTRQWRDTDRLFDWVERKRVCPLCNHLELTIEIPRSVWDRYRREEL